jgi:hypothetical protein
LCQYLLANFLRIQGQVHLASFEKWPPQAIGLRSFSN